jgi:glutaredoxin
MEAVIKIIWMTVLLTPIGCGRLESKSDDTSSDSKIQAPSLTDERTDLVLSWFEDGKAKVGAKVSDVPDSQRKEVRVQDPNTPPEKSDPDTIFIADLTAPKKDGQYPVRAVSRTEFEAKRRAVEEKAEKARLAALAAQAQAQQQAAAQQQGKGGDVPKVAVEDGAPPVIMYSTTHCPVCVSARRWMLDNKIPYMEKDIETDQAAAAELQQKGAAQNVSVRGVPVFDIYGTLVPGFDAATIAALINRGPGAKLQQI